MKKESTTLVQKLCLLSTCLVVLADCGGGDARGVDAACEDGGSPAVVDTSVDAGTLEVEVGSWVLCPHSWPPAPPLVYCGVLSGVTCFETDAPTRMPCRYESDPVVVVMRQLDHNGGCEVCSATFGR